MVWAVSPCPDTHALPGDPGYHLHSAELSFIPSTTGRKMVIECEPPELLRCTTNAR